MMPGARGRCRDLSAALWAAADNVYWNRRQPPPAYRLPPGFPRRLAPRWPGWPDDLERAGEIPR